jgi:hypothetical protein
MTNKQDKQTPNNNQLTERQKTYDIVAKPIAGRDTLCTEDNIELIVKAVRDGLTYKDAAQLVGISEDTIYNWQRLAKRAQLMQERGQELSYNDIAYLRFFHELNKAKLEKKRKALTQIALAAEIPKHWTANAWYLERVYPNEFAKVQRHEITDWRKDAKKQELDPEEILLKVVDLLERQYLESSAQDADYKEVDE